MKKMFAVLAMLTFSGCASSTEYGQCIGAFDDGEKNLKYSTSGRNVGLSIISFIIPPVGFVVTGVVVASQLKCPTGRF